MSVMDEFQTERESIKDAPFKTKAIYFWDYYKWHVIVAIIAVWLVGSLIHHYATYKEIGFHAVMVNSTHMYPEESYAEDFAALTGIDTEEYDVYFDTSMYLSPDYYDESTMATVQKIMVYFSAGDLDVFVCDYPNSAQYIYNSAFCDLRSILTPEQIAKLEPYFVYADDALLQQIEADREANDMKDTYAYPTDSSAAAMEIPVPVGISLKDCKAFKDTFYYDEADVNLYIFINNRHPELCLQFVDYVCKEILE